MAVFEGRMSQTEAKRSATRIGSENMTSRACIVGLGGHVESTVLNKALTASESRFLVENEQLQSF